MLRTASPMFIGVLLIMVAPRVFLSKTRAGVGSWPSQSISGYIGVQAIANDTKGLLGSGPQRAFLLTSSSPDASGGSRAKQERGLGGVRRHARGAVLADLGFEVSLDHWPCLLHRSSVDRYIRPELKFRWLDVGEVRVPGLAMHIGILTDSSWCHQAYTYGQHDSGMELIVSRLTPALLITTSSQTLELFAGDKLVDQGSQRVTKSTQVPAYVAFATSSGTVVPTHIGTGKAVSLADMEECWMLFWYGTSSDFRRYAVPAVLTRGSLTSLVEKGLYVPADLPVLVVFQRKPEHLEPTRDALRLAFDKEGACSVALVAPMGFYHPHASVTAEWKNGLPKEVVARCRAWARRLKYFPLSCAESWKSDQDGTITIQQRFTYRALPDAWQTRAEKIAPFPPVAALAERYGFPLVPSSEVVDYQIPTHSGPYSGVAGTDVVEFSVSGLRKYIEEAVVEKPPTGADAKVLAQELRSEVRQMIDSWPLAPAKSISSRMLDHFRNPGEAVLAVAESMPYLDRDLRAKAAAWAFDQLEQHNPLTAAKVSFEGVPRGYYEPAEGKKYRRPLETLIDPDTRADSVYAIWALGWATGQWDRIRPMWNEIRHACSLAEADWPTCNTLGGAGAINGRISRWVALARMARRFGDMETADRAAYLLAQAALQRFAQQALIRYIYDEKIQTIDMPEDWMLTFSTRSGNGGGHGALWIQNWADAHGDVRACASWDEFGPELSQLEDSWHPVFLHFHNLTPECGRFLGDYLLRDCEKFIRAVERNAPGWFITHRQAYLGKEYDLDSPLNPYTVFLGRCYAARADGREMLKYQDIPYSRYGDLYHIRKLVANLRCFGPIEWEKIGKQESGLHY